MRKNNQKNKTNATNATFVALAGLVSLTTVSGLMLASTKVFADDIVDDVAITVPISCTISGTGQNSHTAEVPNGTYQANIGTTTMNVLCNDASGFSIYAAGFTGEEVGGNDSNKLVGTEASSNAKIVTGTATTAGNPDISNWAMKLATDSEASYPLTLTTGYNAFHEVPNEFTKVATRLAGTDVGQNATGSTFTTTYATYISKTQAADTYSGKVKYVLVHPNDGAAPSNVPTLISTVTCATQVPGAAYMQDINSSNKASILASMTEDAEYFLRDARDNKDYCVAKLKDGNLWMTQNLDHDIKNDGTVTYDNTTTDLGWNTSTNSYDTASWIPSTGGYTHDDTSEYNWYRYYEEFETDYPWQDSFGGYYYPESYDPGELYWDGVLQSGISANHTTSTGDAHYHLGNYYNWLAATALDSDIEIQYENGYDVDRSICPAGWTLPKGGEAQTGSGSFSRLFSQYGLSALSNYEDGYIDSNTLFGSPFYYVLGDNVERMMTDQSYIGMYGAYWSSVYDGQGDGYAIIYTLELSKGNHNNITVNYSYSADHGLSVRCVAR